MSIIMEKLVFLYCLQLFSLLILDLKMENESKQKVIISIKDSNNIFVIKDTLSWNKIDKNSQSDSTVLFIKSDKLMRKLIPPMTPLSSLPFKISKSETVLLKLFTRDSLFIEIQIRLNKGEYRFEFVDLNKESGIYGIYFKSEEQIFKDKLIYYK